MIVKIRQASSLAIDRQDRRNVALKEFMDQENALEADSFLIEFDLDFVERSDGIRSRFVELSTGDTKISTYSILPDQGPAIDIDGIAVGQNDSLTILTIDPIDSNRQSQLQQAFPLRDESNRPS